jgi:hypothetical protein
MSISDCLGCSSLTSIIPSDLQFSSVATRGRQVFLCRVVSRCLAPPDPTGICPRYFHGIYSVRFCVPALVFASSSKATHSLCEAA